jgi:hypothetical protein
MGLFVELTNNLSLKETDDARTSRVCKQLSSVTERDPATLATFANSENGKQLLAKLLSLTGSPDEDISCAAGGLIKALEKELSTSSKGQVKQMTRSLLNIISDSVVGDRDLS